MVSQFCEIFRGGASHHLVSSNAYSMSPHVLKFKQRDFLNGCSFEPLPKGKRAMEIVLAFMEQYPQLAQKASELQHGFTLAYRRRLWQLTD